MNKKIGIIGAGDIGFAIAEIMAISNFDVNLYNRYQEVDGKPGPNWLAKMGRLMDMTDGLQLEECGNVKLTSDIKDLDYSQVVVITSGAKRQNPKETREDLAKKNAIIMDGFVDFIAKNENSLILIISNPVDFITQYLVNKVAEKTGKDLKEVAKKIVGVSLVDSMRLKNLVRNHLNANNISHNPDKLTAYSIGEHGPSMVPVMSQIKIDNKKFAEIIDNKAKDEIAKQTILRGNDIIKLTGASSVYGPAYAAVLMINKMYKYDEVELPASVFDGERCIGNLALFHKFSLKEILHLDLSEDEEESFNQSKIAMDKQYKLIVKGL